MELEGLKRSLVVLKEKGVEVTNVVTDRHVQVKKYMREEHPDIEHEYDCWHVVKGQYLPKIKKINQTHFPPSATYT